MGDHSKVVAALCYPAQAKSDNLSSPSLFFHALLYSVTAIALLSMGVTSILSRINTPQNIYKCLIIKNVLRNELEHLVYVVVVTTRNALISFPRDIQQFERIASRSKAVYHFPPFQLS